MSKEFERYEKYLNLIGEKMLDKHFEEQKDYIHCKLGCSLCCEVGEYPFSELEIQYAMLGYNYLSENEKISINLKVEELKTQKEATNSLEFLHICPFLIDKKCCIYKHRGIICRTHGLMFFKKDKNGAIFNKGANCVLQGLNYSNVYDKETKMISMELWKQSGIKTKPIAYNLSRETLLNNEVTQQLNINFGETKSLLDWFEQPKDDTE